MGIKPGQTLQQTQRHSVSNSFEVNSKDIAQDVPANIYLHKVKNRNTKKRCNICSKLTVRDQNDVNDAILASLLASFNIFSTFF